MAATPPPGSKGEDEVLSFLERLERMLARLIEGIGVFFVHRIPKWMYEVIRACLEDIWAYLERAVRVLVRLVRVMILTAVLLAIVLGPLFVLSNAEAPALAYLVWVVLIFGAIAFGLRRYIRKELERRRQAKTARVARPQVCANCRTAARGPEPPSRCPHCGADWRGVQV
jgi:hypothetical protein